MQSDCDPFPESVVDAVVQHIKDIRSESIFVDWYYLTQMELLGYDWLLERRAIQNLLDRMPGAIFGSSGRPDPDRERILLLQMRDRVRQENGLQPLSDEKRASWGRTWPEFLRYHYNGPRVRTGSVVRSARKLTVDEIEKVGRYIQSSRPDAVFWLRFVKQNNDRASKNYTKGVKDHWLGAFWVKLLVEDAISRLIEREGDMGVSYQADRVCDFLIND